MKMVGGSKARTAQRGGSYHRRTFAEVTKATNAMPTGTQMRVPRASGDEPVTGRRLVRATPCSPHRLTVLGYRGVKEIGRAAERFIGPGASEHQIPVNVGGKIVAASVCPRAWRIREAEAAGCAPAMEFASHARRPGAPVTRKADPAGRAVKRVPPRMPRCCGPPR